MSATATIKVACLVTMEALGEVPGVLSASVNLATERAHVVAVAGTGLDKLRMAVEAAGYEADTADLEKAGVAPVARGLPDWWPVAPSALLTAPLLVPMPGYALIFQYSVCITAFQTRT